MKLCVSVGGTITGEHGVGVDKRGYMDLVHNEVELDMLRRVRRVFDPEALLNPGKVVPDGKSATGPGPAGVSAAGRSPVGASG
jgi:FAD/FMN-containing dehydrogenase